MERTFSGIKDVDRKILEELDDKDLFQILLVDKYLSNVTDENFWKNRLNKKYSGALAYKKGETWKQYYLSTIYYIDKMKREFVFNYIQGDPKFYYDTNVKINWLINPSQSGYDRAYYTAKLIKDGYEDLALYLANKGAKIFQYQTKDFSPEEWKIRKAHYLNVFHDKFN